MSRNASELTDVLKPQEISNDARNFYRREKIKTRARAGVAIGAPLAVAWLYCACSGVFGIRSEASVFEFTYRGMKGHIIREERRYAFDYYRVEAGGSLVKATSVIADDGLVIRANGFGYEVYQSGAVIAED